MSLAKIMLRNLTVCALLDKTWAGSEVQSSILMPINEIREGEAPVPVLAVFTDQSRTNESDISGRDLIGANDTVTLAMEIAVFSAPPGADANQAEVYIPESDEGMEMTLDVIERQAFAELQGGRSLAADLWREFVFRVTGMTVERGVGIEKGVRFAARRIEVRLELIADPVPGAALPSTWERALDYLEQEEQTRLVGQTLRALAEGAPAPPWRALQAELGLTDAGVRAVAMGPFVGSETDAGDITEAASLASEDKDREELIKVVADGATVDSGAGPEPLCE